MGREENLFYRFEDFFLAMNFLDQRNQGLFRGGDTINTFSASSLLFLVYASTFCLLQVHEGLKHTGLPWRRGVRSDTARGL